MTQVADTDLRDFKASIDTLSRSSDANTRVIEALAKLAEANTKAIADLTLEMRVGFANVDTKFVEVDTKFAKLEGKVDNLETKLNSKIDNLEINFRGEIKLLDSKVDTLEINLGNKVDLTRSDLTDKLDPLDERTKLGFWGFILRGVIRSGTTSIAIIILSYILPRLPR